MQESSYLPVDQPVTPAPCLSLPSAKFITSDGLIGTRCTLLNARSLLPKITDLLALFHLKNAFTDILAITETWLDASVNSAVFGLDATHTTFRNDRNRHGGGVLLFCANVLAPSFISCLTTNFAECIAVLYDCCLSPTYVFFS